jgi:nuclear pore complex protein Nup98-Nup96
LDGKGQCIVDDFYIGRYQCGGVQFLGSTNVAGLNLDALITISENEVVVYPDERKKPPVGKGLNKKAIITFENVRPQSTDDRPLSRDEIVESGFEEMLRARIASTMEDAEFLAYKADTGQVSFIVKHFSKYKLFLTKDDVIVHPGKRQKTVEAPPAWSTDLLDFNSEAGEDADLGFENFSKVNREFAKMTFFFSL